MLTLKQGLALAVLFSGCAFAQTSYLNGNLITEGTANSYQDTGSANTVTIAGPSGATVSGNYAGKSVSVRIAATNTGYTTLQIDSVVAVPIKKMVSGTLTDLSPGDLVAGTVAQFIYQGSVWQLENPASLNDVSMSEYPSVAMLPLANFVQAMNNASNQIVNVVVFGDSLSDCSLQQNSCGVGPALNSQRWPDQLRNYFAAQGISHGTGIIPVNHVFNNNFNSIYSWSGGGNWVSILGPYETQGNTNSPILQMPTGSTLSFSSQTFDHVNVYWASTSSSGSLTLNVDGTGVGTFSGTTSSATAHVGTSSAVTLGAHTGNLVCTGTCYVYGLEFTTGTTGVAIHNLSVGGIAAEFFAGNPATNFAFSDLIPGGTHLAITFIGTNEQVNSFPVCPTSDTSAYCSSTGAVNYKNTMNTLVTHEQGQGASVLVWSEPPAGPDNQYAALLPNYWAAAKDVASAKGAAYMQVVDRWGSGAAALANGLFAGDSTEMHPGLKGQNDLTKMIAGYLLSLNPFPSSGASQTQSSGYTSSGAATFAVATSNSATPYTQAALTLGVPSETWGLFLSNAASGSYSNVFELYDITNNKARAEFDTSGGACFGGTITDGACAGSTLQLAADGNATLTSNNSGYSYLHLDNVAESTSGVHGFSLASVPSGTAGQYLLTDRTANKTMASFNSGIFAVPSGLQLGFSNATKPNCDASDGQYAEGEFWYTPHSGSTKGSLQICVNSGSGYLWVTLY